MEWRNPCGGKRWRIHPNGYIEVEGEGFPEYEPGSDKFRYMAQTWENWAPYFQAASKEFGVPVSYLLAVASIETGLWSDDPAEQATIGSYAGAVGVMQLMTVAKRHVEQAFPDKTFGAREDPAENIRMGAALLRDLLDKNSWSFPEVSAIYNSGSKCATGRNEWNLRADHNYPRHVITWNNTALSHLNLNPVSGLWWIAGGVAVGGAIAWLILTDRIYKHPDTGMPWFRLRKNAGGHPVEGIPVLFG
jgi:hypothetical protein